MRIPRWLAALLVVVLAAAGGLYWASRPPPRLTVVSWGADYGRAQAVAMFHPYTDKSGVDVVVANYGGGLKEISAQVGSGKIDWDVVDLELENAAKACRDGLLERLDGMELPPGANGRAAARDFVPGAIGPCWVGTAVYSQVIAYDKARFAADAPARPADFFDLAHFPGPRGLRDSGPKYNLELALIADGVPSWQVYSVLATKTGQDRAFAKLDSIKPQIVWWKKVAEPTALLAGGRVAMTTVLNSHVFSVDVAPKIGTVWDGQLYQMDVFGIPKGDPRLKRALDFIRFATGTQALAAEARWLPYGPARLSAVRLVGRNPETNEEMAPHLPTAAPNFTDALAVDPDWWAAHGAALETRWAEWRKAPSPSPPSAAPSP
jgi:putative spermidine/putrescine transport system substrate-binding protein